MSLCLHDEDAWPINGYQRCRKCGSRRKYEIGSEPGPREAPEPAEQTKGN